MDMSPPDMGVVELIEHTLIDRTESMLLMLSTEYGEGRSDPVNNRSRGEKEETVGESGRGEKGLAVSTC